MRSSILILAKVTTLVSILGTAAICQTGTHNNPYSPSPGRTAVLPAQTPSPASNTQKVAFVMQPQQAMKERIDVKPVPPTDAAASAAPSEIYKIGIGDVLVVDLKNADQGSGYYTVKPDGSIDYPLAGDDLVVTGRTADQVSAILASAITLYARPQVSVRVREYASHKITVTGKAANTGERCLQREAVPLFVVKAAAIPDGSATTVAITRSPGAKSESYKLGDVNTDNVLIYPGNSVEFTGDSATDETYFVTGASAQTGQRPLAPGLTLYQAAVAAGMGDAKKVTMRRKSPAGTLVTTEFNLRAIRDGKAQDKQISPGDIIEFKN